MKFIAQIISAVYHPLIMLTYMLILLLVVNPYLFGVNSLHEGIPMVLRVFACTFLLPGFAAVLMQKLGLISSITMREKNDRIGPFIVTGVFYLWAFRSAVADTNTPTAFLVAILGATLVLFVCFFINIFFKVSVHAAGVTGFAATVIIALRLYSIGSIPLHFPYFGSYDVSLNLILMLSIISVGLVMMSRLKLHAHTARELYAGVVVGLICQFIALKILV